MNPYQYIFLSSQVTMLIFKTHIKVSVGFLLTKVFEVAAAADLLRLKLVKEENELCVCVSE